MTPFHAVEITLTRPTTRSELRHAWERARLAANADRTRLMAVHSARSPSGALHVLRHQLGSRLPIGNLTAHYPDRHGQVLLNIALSRSADAALRRRAAALGQRPQDVLSQCVAANLARREQERTRRLEDRLESLLAHHTLEEVLVCAARALRGRYHHCMPAAP
ncbi:hypothetical protein [Streptomyces sp. NPDC056817]|uniref:hypothetical protein n=1 Tax=Streptomyces sp. NPDC056817 TaxID=3345950 RepID=UPI00368B9CAF